jgi:S-disulfanyl-L-cysteine oxidoreductase SoxD
MVRTLLAVLLLASVPHAVRAFRPAVSDQSGLGRTPTADELKAIDVDVLPDGRGLPPGSGTVKTGREVYSRHCASCHGATGVEGPSNALAGGQGSLVSSRPIKTVGSFWPYAPTLWDYINRAMPYQQPGTLTVDEVYSVTAYVLRLNGLVSDDVTLNRETLPQVKMPNRQGFVRVER